MRDRKPVSYADMVDDGESSQSDNEDERAEGARALAEAAEAAEEDAFEQENDDALGEDEELEDELAELGERSGRGRDAAYGESPPARAAARRRGKAGNDGARKTYAEEEEEHDSDMDSSGDEAAEVVREPTATEKILAQKVATLAERKVLIAKVLGWRKSKSAPAASASTAQAVMSSPGCAPSGISGAPHLGQVVASFLGGGVNLWFGTVVRHDPEEGEDEEQWHVAYEAQHGEEGDAEDLDETQLRAGFKLFEQQAEHFKRSANVEYFVRFKREVKGKRSEKSASKPATELLSYRHCEWVTGDVFMQESKNAALLKRYLDNKNADGVNWERHEAGDSNIPAEGTEIDCVISERRASRQQHNEYLVKWRNCDMDEASWERLKCAEEMEEFSGLADAGNDNYSEDEYDDVAEQIANKAKKAKSKLAHKGMSHKERKRMLATEKAAEKAAEEEATQLELGRQAAHFDLVDDELFKSTAKFQVELSRTSETPAHELGHDSIVWAKIRGQPWWPGQLHESLSNDCVSAAGFKEELFAYCLVGWGGPMQVHELIEGEIALDEAEAVAMIKEWVHDRVLVHWFDENKKPRIDWCLKEEAHAGNLSPKVLPYMKHREEKTPNKRTPKPHLMPKIKKAMVMAEEIILENRALDLADIQKTMEAVVLSLAEGKDYVKSEDEPNSEGQTPVKASPGPSSFEAEMQEGAKSPAASPGAPTSRPLGAVASIAEVAAKREEARKMNLRHSEERAERERVEKETIAMFNEAEKIQEIEEKRIEELWDTMADQDLERLGEYKQMQAKAYREEITPEAEQGGVITRGTCLATIGGEPTEKHAKGGGPESKVGWRLRTYQVDGVNWLLNKWQYKVNTILADEMGLGKTAQTVNVIKHLVEGQGVEGPYLVIVPLSTIGHWVREFEEWSNLKVLNFSGSRQSRDIMRDFQFLSRSPKRVMFNVCVTTYEMLKTEFNRNSGGCIFTKLAWRYVVVDEAHRLKNAQNQTTRFLNDMTYEHLLLLTGTPIQNNLEELFTLLKLLDPVKYASYDEFSQRFNMEKNSAEQTQRLKAELEPWLIRRMKGDVDNTISEKEEIIVKVELTVAQKKWYRAIIDDNCSALATGSKLVNRNNIQMELTKLCNHPMLIDGYNAAAGYSGYTDRYNKENRADFQKNIIGACGKMVLLDKMLTKFRAEKRKVLIFSQMTMVLDILQDYMDLKHYPCERLDGNVKMVDRQQSIDRFTKATDESEAFVFLLSTRAGGVGINLTAADTCIIYDSDWNPQSDLQAQARCHRIGQTKKVNIYRLITSKTYEEVKFQRSCFKLALDQALLALGGDDDGDGIETEDAEAAEAKLKKMDDVDHLLKYGAYNAMKEDDGEAEAFALEDIDSILANRAEKVVYGEQKSSFKNATFSSSADAADVDLNDPDFWKKYSVGNAAPEELGQRSRKTVQRSGMSASANSYVPSYDEAQNDSSDYGSSDEEGGAKKKKPEPKERPPKPPKVEKVFVFKWTKDEIETVQIKMKLFGSTRPLKILDEMNKALDHKLEQQPRAQGTSDSAPAASRRRKLPKTRAHMDLLIKGYMERLYTAQGKQPPSTASNAVDLTGGGSPAEEKKTGSIFDMLENPEAAQLLRMDLAVLKSLCTAGSMDTSGTKEEIVARIQAAAVEGVKLASPEGGKKAASAESESAAAAPAGAAPAEAAALAEAGAAAAMDTGDNAPGATDASDAPAAMDTGEKLAAAAAAADAAAPAKRESGSAADLTEAALLAAAAPGAPATPALDASGQPMPTMERLDDTALLTKLKTNGANILKEIEMCNELNKQITEGSHIQTAADKESPEACFLERGSYKDARGSMPSCLTKAWSGTQDRAVMVGIWKHGLANCWGAILGDAELSNTRIKPFITMNFVPEMDPEVERKLRTDPAIPSAKLNKYTKKLVINTTKWLAGGSKASPAKKKRASKPRPKKAKAADGADADSDNEFASKKPKTAAEVSASMSAGGGAAASKGKGKQRTMQEMFGAKAAISAASKAAENFDFPAPRDANAATGKSPKRLLSKEEASDANLEFDSDGDKPKPKKAKAEASGRPPAEPPASAMPAATGKKKPAAKKAAAKKPKPAAKGKAKPAAKGKKGKAKSKPPSGASDGSGSSATPIALDAEDDDEEEEDEKPGPDQHAMAAAIAAVSASALSPANPEKAAAAASATEVAERVRRKSKEENAPSRSRDENPFGGGGGAGESSSAAAAAAAASSATAGGREVKAPSAYWKASDTPANGAEEERTRRPSDAVTPVDGPAASGADGKMSGSKTKLQQRKSSGAAASESPQKKRKAGAAVGGAGAGQATMGDFFSAPKKP